MFKGDNNSQQLHDARALPEGQVEVEEEAPLTTWPDEASLKNVTSFAKEAKGAEKGTTLICDHKNTYYLLSRLEDRVILKGTLLGSVGGGSLLPTESGERRSVVPWELPLGDRTLVQMMQSDDMEVKDTKDAKEGKPSTGTLYSIVRELEASAATELTLTSFGRLLPKGEAGRHSYEFEYPPWEPEAREDGVCAYTPGLHKGRQEGSDLQQLLQHP